MGSPAKIIATTFTFEQVIEHEKRVFPIEERMDEGYLRMLFETEFKGLRAIGTDEIKTSDLETANKVTKIINSINNHS